jgi:hypothetical protein
VAAIGLAEKILRMIDSKSPVTLADFSDASHFNNRGFLLPFCKSSSPLVICVDTGESLTILVK